ncbi:MAG: diaminopimelate epimerase [Ignavibacteriales bacterium]|nr:diaminopimelate epimerase [Ignavibacteriales bacterium]
MKKISFAKMSGAGNDFILFDRRFNPDMELHPAVIKKLCNRRTGIGADGILIISDFPGYDFMMEYFNSDGSTGSLCGNGARCAIRYAHLSGRINNATTNFISNNVQYAGEILDADNVKFYLSEPKNFKYNFKIKTFNQLVSSSFVDTGSPHVVIKLGDVLQNVQIPNSFYQDLDDFPVVQYGREIRNSKDFAPSGTNVNFIKIVDNKIFIRTYERGVEDETLACGTGSTAAAIISYVNDKLKPPITVVTKSGNELIIDFKVEDQHIRNLSLTGPAEITFTGEFYSSLYFNNSEK